MPFERGNCFLFSRFLVETATEKTENGRYIAKVQKREKKQGQWKWFVVNFKLIDTDIVCCTLNVIKWIVQKKAESSTSKWRLNVKLKMFRGIRLFQWFLLKIGFYAGLVEFSFLPYTHIYTHTQIHTWIKTAFDWKYALQKKGHCFHWSDPLCKPG